VGSHNGTVYSLDAKTGCIYWTYSAKSSVRSALSIGPRAGSSGYAVYFGDTFSNVYALDATTGKEIWSRKIEEHPMARATGSATLYKDRVYVGFLVRNPGSIRPTSAAHFVVLPRSTPVGTVAWKTYLVQEPKPEGKNKIGTTL
jgi:polyvinyl alcohol dehydrogenase (cytochrome)